MSETARQTFAADFEAFQRALAENYDNSQASVYVDGVKSISRVYALLASGVHIDGVIHLRRDPADYAGSTMNQMGRSWHVFLASLAQYSLYHRMCRRVARAVPYISMTYEGLCDNPDGTIRALFNFVGVQPKTIGELQQAKQKVWHFMGNASLFHFDGKIRRSSHPMTVHARRLVTLLAGEYDARQLHLKASQ